MNTSRITVSLPVNLLEKLKIVAPKGQISEYVAETLKEKLYRVSLDNKKEILDEIVNLRSKVDKKNTNEIIESIKIGRN